MEPQTNNTDSASSAESQAGNEPQTSPGYTQNDQQPSGEVSEYRTFAILGYILPFLFFLPLLDDKTKNVPFVRFHANQQLILLVIVLGMYILHNVLFVMLMSLGYLVAQVLNLAILALAIYGAYNAYLGKMKELLYVGQFRILK